MVHLELETTTNTSLSNTNPNTSNNGMNMNNNTSKQFNLHNSKIVNECVSDLLLFIHSKSLLLSSSQIQHLQNDIDDIFTIHTHNNNNNNNNNNSNCTSSNREIHLYKEYIKYPFQTELKNSTVFHFSNDLSKFNPIFLELLHSVYGTTNSNNNNIAGNNTTHYRINLVKSNGNIHALEFSNQYTYWGCIRQLILIHNKIEIINFYAKCKISIISDSNRTKGYIQKNKNNEEDCICEIIGSLITVVSANNKEERFSTDILELAAITLSADNQPVRPYIWQISCSLQDPLDEDMNSLISECSYKIITSLNQIISIGSGKSIAMIPISYEEAARGEYKEGQLSILFSGPKLVSMVNTSNYYDPHISFTPFTASLTSHIQDAKCTSLISLPIATYSQGLRLVIKRAADIYYASKDNTLPSPYCIGYLLNAEGNKITKNSVEHRTLAAPNTIDPVWDREMFFLFDPSAAFVHVKIRHHKSYFSKEEHIGQVSIPIDCFVEGVEAHLCLPLEPTYRMEGQFNYGEIHILTEMVYLDPNDIKSGDPNLKVLRKRPVSSLPLAVESSLRMVEDLYNVWWPCRLFSGLELGAMFCGFSSMLLMVRASIVVSEQYTQYVEYEDGYLSVPWWQVVSAVHISEASLIVTVALRHIQPDQEAVHLDFLVGPTRAIDIETMILEQRSVCGFRLQLEKLFIVMSQDQELLAAKFLQESIGVQSSLETVISDCYKSIKTKSNELAMLSSDAAIIARIQQRKYIKAMLYMTILRRKITSLIDQGYLPHVFGEKEVYEFVSSDLFHIDETIPISSNIDNFTTRIETIVTHAVTSLRKLFLCSIGQLNLNQINILSQCIQDYYDAAVDTISVYESPTSGEEIKIGIIKFLISFNNILEEKLNPILHCFGLKCLSSLCLVETTKFHQMSVWYSNSLIISIKSWLGKNIQYVNINKTISTLPWDYTLLGSLIISHLPESFHFQLNIFFDLCSNLQVHRKDNQQRIQKNNQLLILNENILHAAGEALELLADEYICALQSRHWALDCIGNELVHNIRFLIACANDSYRIQQIHLLPFKTIQTTSSSVTDKIIATVKDAFEKVRMDSLKRLSRVFFTDLTDHFTNFESQWASAGSYVLVGSIIATLDDYFKDVQMEMEMINFITVLNKCCGIVCSRYLLFLRGRSLKRIAFTIDEIQAVSGDVSIISRGFKVWIERVQKSNDNVNSSEVSSIGSEVITTLKFLHDAHLLLTESSSKLKGLVSAVLNAYPKEMHQIASNVLKLLNLRQDFDSELSNMVAAEEKRFYFADSKAEDCVANANDLDLFVRVFSASPEEILGSAHKGFSTPSRGGLAKQMSTMKVVREMAANLTGVSVRRQEEQTAGMQRAVGLQTSISRASSEGDLSHLPPEEIRAEDVCYVVISRVEVKGLVSSSFLGMCNPYVVFTLGNSRYKTSVQWNKTSTASWPSQVMTLKANKIKLSSLSLHVEVIDKERIRRKKILGEVNVKLSGLELHSIDSWFAVDSYSVSNCAVRLHIALSQ